jgi:hypothetical protein
MEQAGLSDVKFKMESDYDPRFSRRNELDGLNVHKANGILSQWPRQGKLDHNVDLGVCLLTIL